MLLLRTDCGGWKVCSSFHFQGSDSPSISPSTITEAIFAIEILERQPNRPAYSPDATKRPHFQALFSGSAVYYSVQCRSLMKVP